MHSEVKPRTMMYSKSNGLSTDGYESLNDHLPEYRQADDPPAALVDGLRKWLRDNLKGMQALLTNLSDSTWYYIRQRWGPDWLTDSVTDKHSRMVKCFEDTEETFAERELSSDAWWLRSREGPPTVRVRKRAGVNTAPQGRPSRLRNPRSNRTRELCLLNRLRVHLNERVLLAVGNEETNWGATVDGVPRLAGSYEIQSQRWARTLPRGPSQYTARRYVSRNAGLPPRSGEARHW